jgi:acetyltransferase (GNAT) family protein
MDHVATRGWTLPGKAVARRLRDNVGAFGLAGTLHDLAVRTLNRTMVFRILRGVTIDRVDPSFLACPEPYQAMFLGEDRLREFAGDPANEMPAAFLDRALANGDECFGLIAGETLAAYGWYARKPTPLDLAGLSLHFDDPYVYMYKGFTHPRHRGRRLHAIGMTRALEHYLGRGLKGLVSYVESNNFASLKSCSRMGYVGFGSIYVLRIGGATFVGATSGCRPYGFHIERTADPA